MVVREDIRSQLSRLVDSDPFRSSPSLVKLLVFCVDTMLAGEEESLKETTIGVACFGRSPGYDPKIDPIVRVSARRLRGKLDLFYENEGREDAIRIDLPKGGYVPRVERCVEKPAESVAASDPAAPVLLPVSLAQHSWPAQRSWPAQYLRVAMLLVAVMLAAASVTFLSLRHFSGTAEAPSAAPAAAGLIPVSYPGWEPSLRHSASSLSGISSAGQFSDLDHNAQDAKLSPVKNLKFQSEPHRTASLKPPQLKKNHASRMLANRSPLNGLRPPSQELTRTPVLEAVSYALPGSFEPRL
jgi:hypothetical protein